MIVTLRQNAALEEVQNLKNALRAQHFELTEVNTQRGSYVVALGPGDFDMRRVGLNPAVQDVHRVSDPFKLVSRKWKVAPTKIDLGNDAVVAEGHCAIIAGPCAIESEQQVASIAQHLHSQGIRMMRGGAFKPRTSPYSFRGLGLEGLKSFSRIARAYGIKVISEVLEVSQIAQMYEYVDIFQVGARNSQNFNLLHELGKAGKPVMVKRGMSGTLDELLQSAEYVFCSGNEQLILCERGIRTFEGAYRNTLDLNAIPYLKEKSHLPVLVDPSHGVGIRRFVEPLALAAMMVGADGVLVEIHPQPEDAISDGQQTLNFEESVRLFRRLREVFELRVRQQHEGEWK